MWMTFNMKTISILLISLCLFSQAEEKLVSKVTTGIGKTKSSATRNALLEAIRQVKGVSLAEQKRISDSFKELSLSKNGQEQSTLRIDENFGQNIQQLSSGRIRSYDIINSEHTGQHWEVEVEAQLSTYKTPGHDPKNRRSLAILPFRTNQPQFGKFKNELNHALVSSLTKSRKFTILDRDYYAEYLQEKALLKSSDTSFEEQYRLASALGVDYMLVGRIQDYSKKETTETLTVTGETHRVLKETAKVDFRIIVMATRQIKWSDSVSLESKTKIEKVETSSKSYEREKPPTAISNKLSRNISTKLLNNIYPLRIVDHSGSQVIINEGSTRLQEGQELTAYLLSQKLIDPYTKESLGRKETELATIKVTKVEAKLSYAVIIEGELTGQNIILRPSQKKTKEATLDSPRESGVRLHF